MKKAIIIGATSGIGLETHSEMVVGEAYYQVLINKIIWVFVFGLVLLMLY